MSNDGPPPFGVTTPRKDGARLLAAFTVPKSNNLGAVCSQCDKFVSSGAYHECWSKPMSNNEPTDGGVMDAPMPEPTLETDLLWAADYISWRSEGCAMYEEDCDRIEARLRALAMDKARSPADEGERLHDTAVAAYLAGARAVHDEWVKADEGERFYLSRDHEPDFTEAAHDYAASIDVPAKHDPAADEGLVERMEQLEAALKPFANIAASDGEDFSAYDPQTIIRCEVTVGELRIARAAFAAIQAVETDRGVG